MLRKISPDKVLFKNITVSGTTCTGSSTLSKMLAETLKWKRRGSGEILREFVAENGIPLEKTTKTPDSLHHKIDQYYANALKNGKGKILEGWLSGFMARGIDGVLKILTICSDDSVAIKRLMKRDGINLKDAKNQFKIREKENLEKWKKIYRTQDFWNPKDYDLVIDTAITSKEEMLRVALKKLGFFRLTEEKRE